MLKNTAQSIAEKIAHFKLLIVGGGSAGITMSSRMLRILKPSDICVTDKSENHYYQPGWTLVAANEIKYERTCRPMSAVIPKGVRHIKAAAKQFLPEENSVLLDNDEKVSYDYLIIATGINPYFDKVSGMQEALDLDPHVFTIYHNTYLKKAYKALSSFSGGNAVFTFPVTEAIKCRGAAVKIFNIADDIFIRNNVKNKTLYYVTPKDYLFPVQKYNDTVTKVAVERGVKILYYTKLVNIDHKKKEITCEKTDGSGEKFTMPYSLVHFTPDMKTADALQSCPLSNENGFVKVDKFTCQHVQYPNVFSIGDCSSLPTSKTLAAVNAQTDILYRNMKAYLEKSPLSSKYDGYTACPLITRIGKIVLAEFDYDKNPLETFAYDQGEESAFAYYLKKYILIQYYWDLLTKFRGHGIPPKQMRKIFNPCGT